MKKALGIKSSKKSPGKEITPAKGSKRPVTVGKLMRIQMGISEQADSRIRRALLRVAASQTPNQALKSPHILAQMARLFRDQRTLRDSKRETDGNCLRFSSSAAMTATDLPSPYGQLGCALSNPELRDTAYEIFVAACRSTGSKPLTNIPQSERTLPSADRALSSAASLDGAFICSKTSGGSVSGALLLRGRHLCRPPRRAEHRRRHLLRLRPVRRPPLPPPDLLPLSSSQDAAAGNGTTTVAGSARDPLGRHEEEKKRKK